MASGVGRLLGITSIRHAAVALAGDPVYGRLALALIGNIQARGLAGWVSVIFTSGSSLAGIQVVRLVVDLGMVLAGFAGLTIRLRRYSPASRVDWPLTLLVAWTAYAAGAMLRLSWWNGSGGAMVLSMVATKLLGLDGRSYDWVTQQGTVFSLALDIMLVAAAATLGSAAGSVISRLPGRIRSTQRQSQATTRTRATMLWGAAVLALSGAAAKPAVAFEQQSSPALRFQSPASHPSAHVSNLPSVVTIAHAASGWDYRVNGRTEVIHGIGYNAVTLNETPEERAARYDRDFGSISAMGANTIAGWTESEFDDLLMQKAAEYGLGVILPFHLGPTYILSEPDFAYEDPQVRRQLLEAVSQRVEHFRNSPALRMWGLGNEVLHAISWARGSQAHAQAFADFLIQAADRVHQMDPNHPVVYRDAEDWYVKPIIQALASNPNPRPWFVYGMNFFTTRLQSALDSGPVTGLDQPLLISEFGPVGLRPEARPAGYRDLWDIIRSHRDRVLGGLAYVWTTAGPEPLDRNFGLTDAEGRLVDGSLSELAALYRGDEQVGKVQAVEEGSP